MADQAGYQRFFAELKRRRVFRVMAVYGVVAFVLLQVVDLLVPALLLPDWTYRFVAILLLLGFPVAVVLAWAFELTPDGVRRTRSATSEEISEIASAPAGKRWPVGLAALGGAALLGLGAGWALSASGPADDSEYSSIAVLPFVNMTGDEEAEYLGDGLAEELLNALAGIRGLRVPSRTSSFAFKGSPADARTIGDSLDVSLVLEGSVRGYGDRLRITAQLIDAEDGYHVWTEQYDRNPEDLLDLQEDIAGRIVAALSVELDAAGAKEILDLGTSDPEAYDLYLRGRHFWNQRDSEDLAVARGLFREAIEIDSSFAPAYAAIADAWVVPSAWRSVPEDAADEEDRIEYALDEGIRYARLALELDPTLAQAHTALAYGLMMRDLDFRRAEQSFARAIELDPDYATARQWFAELLSAMDRHEEAVREVRRAEAIDPTRIIRWNVGRVLYFAGRYEEAIEQLEPLIAEPGVHTGAAAAYQVFSYQMAEDYEGLLASLESEMEGDSSGEGGQGPPPGFLEGARRAVEAGEMPRFLADVMSREFEDSPFPYRAATMIARSWASVEPDSAFAHLRFIAETPDEVTSRVAWFEVLTDPAFDPLRDDPRYEELNARFGL